MSDTTSTPGRMAGRAQADQFAPKAIERLQELMDELPSFDLVAWNHVGAIGAVVEALNGTDEVTQDEVTDFLATHGLDEHDPCWWDELFVQDFAEGILEGAPE